MTQSLEDLEDGKSVEDVHSDITISGMADNQDVHLA
jgi:hypothetical protein